MLTLYVLLHKVYWYFGKDDKNAQGEHLHWDKASCLHQSQSEKEAILDGPWVGLHVFIDPFLEHSLNVTLTTHRGQEQQKKSGNLNLN